jgi:phosphate-selective porin OprO and OprP
VKHLVLSTAAAASAIALGWTAPVQAQTSDANPQDSTKAEWSVKPRGRIQAEIGSVEGPNLDLPTNQAELGTDFRIRRAYLGVDIVMPGNFGARLEADFAGDAVSLTDAYVFYKPSKQLTITAGHQKAFFGLEDMTSDNFSSFQERAAYSTAFGFERRVGLSAAYAGKDFLVQAGVFTDDTSAFGFPSSSSSPRAFDDAVSFDARAVYMPKLGDSQLHLGGSIHYRDFKDTQAVRYRARPFVRTTHIRFVDTKALAGTEGELGLGAEFAYLRGPIHVAVESYWQKALRRGLGDRTFNGGYAEVGYVVTGESRAYKGGTFDRLSPKNELGKGGVGAVELNLRYDWLDLNSGPVVGGKQDLVGLSLVWVPLKHLRFTADYGHLWFKDSPVTANGGRRDYEADAFGLRVQFDF